MAWWMLAGLVVLLVFPGVRRMVANAALALVVFVTVLTGGLLLGFDAAYVFLTAIAGVGVTLLARRQRGKFIGRSTAASLPEPAPEPEQQFDPPRFADEPTWLAFRERLGSSEGTRADAALADMAALLGETAGRPPLDSASEHARRIEHDVPEFLGIALGRCERATPAEARRYLTVALEKCEAIATKARAERERLRRADDASFDSYSSYLDQTSARREG